MYIAVVVHVVFSLTFSNPADQCMIMSLCLVIRACTSSARRRLRFDLCQNLAAICRHPRCADLRQRIIFRIVTSLCRNKAGRLYMYRTRRMIVIFASLSLARSCLLACWGFGVKTPGPKANPSTVRNCVCWLPRFGVLQVCSLQVSTVYPPPRNTPAKTVTA